MWAFAGALIVAFIAYVIINWITGPYFESVAPGRTPIPTWMQADLTFWQVVAIPAGLVLIYVTAIRPWRRGEEIGVLGLMAVACLVLWWQDPISDAQAHWFTSNAGLINFGSWANSLPWSTSFAKPGAAVVEGIFFLPGAYVLTFPGAAWLGSRTMRWASRRWPRITTAGLVAFCFVAMMLFDLVFEGVTFLPLGMAEYGGGHLALFPGTYHKFPLTEMPLLGGTLTAMACLLHFTDDKGRSYVDRGLDQVRGSRRKKFGLRLLAMIAATNLIMFIIYNVPATLLAPTSTAWPKDMQQRSYLLDNLCGAGTDRACPGPAVPNIRNGAAYIDASGKAVFPRGVRLAPVVPLAK
jgi:hypothetical protein